MQMPVRMVRHDPLADARHRRRDGRRAGEHGADDEQDRDVLGPGLAAAAAWNAGHTRS